ncbi:MAG: preprotein translocase subunit SecG [Longicatena sp.]
MSVFDVLLMITAVVLIILSLLQSGKSDGLGGAFGAGEGLNLFANVKERGAEKVMSNVTLTMGIAFFALVIIIRIIK